jgi:hypothetical protein
MPLLDTAVLASAIRDATRGDISEETVKIRVEGILANYRFLSAMSRA